MKTVKQGATGAALAALLLGAWTAGARASMVLRDPRDGAPLSYFTPDQTEARLTFQQVSALPLQELEAVLSQARYTPCALTNACDTRITGPSREAFERLSERWKTEAKRSVSLLIDRLESMKKEPTVRGSGSIERLLEQTAEAFATNAEIDRRKAVLQRFLDSLEQPDPCSGRC